ncbi:MAG: GNAT family N-acetyltransferase [Elusimicrobia bacterium]|nr:GNAT family N-acetyltransferase [Elusimicrobiota bacterium]
MPPPLIIRKAARADAKPLSELAERTFRATFSAANAPENMDSHCRTTYSERIQADEISHPDMVTLLSQAQDALIGFAQLRWGAAPGCVRAESPGEIQRLYLDDAWHGKGAAQGLMDACLAEFRGRGSAVVWLGVWERNPRAIAFYKKFGFNEVGEQVFRLGDDRQRDVVMARPVDAR